VRVHVGDGRDADARRLDDVDGVMPMCGQTWPGAAASFLGIFRRKAFQYRFANDFCGETTLPQRWGGDSGI